MIIVHVLTRLLKAGAEENTLATCYHQIDEGHEVFLLYGEEREISLVREAESRGVVCIQINCLVHKIDPINDLKAILALRKLYAKFQPQILHTHQSKAGVIARLAAIGTGITVVHTVHIVPFNNTGLLSKWIYISAEKICSLTTDHFIDVSKGTRDSYLKYSIGRCDNHEVVYSGMKIRKYSDLRKLRVGNTDKEKKFTVVMMAAFQKRKRHAELLQALAPVLEKRRNIEILFLGQGETEYEIRQQVKDLSLDAKVQFPGHVSNPEDYVATADLGILVSEREGLPRVLVQFVAAGVPVVTTWLPGIDEIVKDNTNGLVFDMNDIGSVAAAIDDLYGDREKLSDLEEGAVNTSVDQWEIDLMGPHISTVYQKVLGKQEVCV